MGFTAPIHTRKQVSKAGHTLINKLSTTPQMDEALEILNHWRVCHAYPVNTFQATLRKRLKKVCEKALVAQRLKRTPSILKKLQNNRGMQLARMQDIGGLRAVLDTVAQVRALEKMYNVGTLQHERIGTDDYIANPKKSGYRSLHLIYKYKNSANSAYDGLCIELQIRTKLQHAWATAVETIGTFLDQALKSSEGSEEWLNYFKVVSAAFAILEKSPVAEEFKVSDELSIFEKANNLTNALEVRSKLNAFAIAANAIQTRQSTGNYHLVVLNAKLKQVEIKSYGKKRLDEANVAYAEAERKANEDPDFQAVLVATNSIDALKRAYPNYFLDTKQFTNSLSKIEKHVKSVNR